MPVTSACGRPARATVCRDDVVAQRGQARLGHASVPSPFIGIVTRGDVLVRAETVTSTGAFIVPVATACRSSSLDRRPRPAGVVTSRASTVTTAGICTAGEGRLHAGRRPS